MAALKILERQNCRSRDESDLNAIAQDNQKIAFWKKISGR
jgi:hypothetical protein